ncbi:MAG: complex I NDUFA9 subunit family protein [Pseudomonadota bacterium]
MPDQYKIACVFGGTGFVGTQVVRELASAGYRVKVATRVPERAYELKTCGVVGQVVPYACNYNDQASISEAVKGSDVVINLIGILFEKGKSTFEKAHKDIPQMIATSCANEGVKRFVHVSALGVDQATSDYARSKLAGEEEILKAFPVATILRPSVVFGPDDEFFNMFAQLARFLPVLPLVGGGKTKFQPVFVGDVADAVMKALSLTVSGDSNPQGKIYELGGPEVLTFKEIYDRLFETTGQKRGLMPLPFGVAKIQGAVFSGTSKIIGVVTGLTPKPLLTADQVESLKTDNIVNENALSFSELGLKPTAMAAILPSYLARFRKGGRFGNKKSA